MRVTNESGEQYDNAQTRLVVGKINLVEKIADLARRPPPGSRDEAGADRQRSMPTDLCREGKETELA